MKHTKIRIGALIVAAWALTGVASTIQAGPPGPSSEQARAAIDKARQLRDALQFHIAEPAAESSTAGARRTNSPAASREDEKRRRRNDRALDQARRSLFRISEHLARAERSLERNPALTLHRVDLALHELRKVERRLETSLQPAEVQP